MKNKRAHKNSLCNFGKKNRRGSKVISVYWFAILFIVAGAVVYMVASFYGEPYDVREIESHILQTQIANCIAEGGYLKEGVLTEMQNNFLDFCNFNFEVEDSYGWKKGSEYYIELGIYDFDENSVAGIGNAVMEIKEGNPNLKTALLLEKQKTTREVDRIVIHYTETETLEAAQTEFANEPSKSIHYLVDKDGGVVKGEVDEEEVAYHAGCLSTRPKCEKSPTNCCIRGMNERSIGIELINNGNEPYTEEQIDSLAKLIADVADRNNIPIDREHIIGHNEVDPGRKADPGDFFPWNEVIEKASAIKVFSPAIERGFYILDENGNQYIVNIFTIIGKEEKNE